MAVATIFGSRHAIYAKTRLSGISGKFPCFSYNPDKLEE